MNLERDTQEMYKNRVEGFFCPPRTFESKNIGKLLQSRLFINDG